MLLHISFLHDLYIILLQTLECVAVNLTLVYALLAYSGINLSNIALARQLTENSVVLSL